MGDFFKTVTSGLARYVFAWLLPSALALGAILILVLPSADADSYLALIVNRAMTGVVPPGLVFLFAIVGLAVLSGYASTFVYRLLEGYHLPRFVRRRLLRHQTRQWWRLYGRQVARTMGAPVRGQQIERAWGTPERLTDVMPTGLGNALRAAETYGRNRWNLDTLTLWHELVSVAPEPLGRELEDARSSMDFFMGLIVQIILVIGVCVSVLPGASDAVPVLVAAGGLLLLWPSYVGAVNRVSEYRSALQALVNLGRQPLAAALGYQLPDRLDREQFFWANLVRFIRDGNNWRGARVDRFRSRPQLDGKPSEPAT